MDQKKSSLTKVLNSLKTFLKTLIEYWNKEKDTLTNHIEALGKKLIGITVQEHPIFESFHQALESPIDMAKSKVEVQPRGFDSFHYNSQYISMKQSLNEIHEKI